MPTTSTEPNHHRLCVCRTCYQAKLDALRTATAAGPPLPFVCQYLQPEGNATSSCGCAGWCADGYPYIPPLTPTDPPADDQPGFQTCEHGVYLMPGLICEACEQEAKQPTTSSQPPAYDQLLNASIDRLQAVYEAIRDFENGRSTDTVMLRAIQHAQNEIRWALNERTTEHGHIPEPEPTNRCRHGNPVIEGMNCVDCIADRTTHGVPACYSTTCRGNHYHPDQCDECGDPVPEPGHRLCVKCRYEIPTP